MNSFKAYPWQEKAISEGIFKNQNMVLCWPTSSGKTRSLMETMIRAAVRGKRSVLILPGVTSVEEKAKTLWSMCEQPEYSHADIKIAYVQRGKTSFKSRKYKRHPIRNCNIIIATYESMDKLLRKGKNLKEETHFKNIDVICADEIHKIYNEARGDTADKVVTWLRYLNPKAQVLFSMATRSGIQELAEWIRGKALIEERRPTNISILIYCLKARSFLPVSCEVPPFFTNIQAEGEVEFYIQLKKIIEQYKGQCLIFNGTRAKTMSCALEYLTYKDTTRSLEGEILDKLISAKTGYLNAGLSQKARDIMIGAYRSGDINSLHTTTLIAEAFDSDTNIVVISDIELAGHELDPADMEQMLGRIRKPFNAGGTYPFGIGIILARNEEQVSKIQNILNSLPDFNSRLEIYDSFLDQVLSLLKHYDWKETECILQQTFFAFLERRKFTEYLKAAKSDLKKIHFVDAHGELTSQSEAAVQYFIPTYIAKKLISMRKAFYDLDINKSLEMLCEVFTEYKFVKFGRTPTLDSSNKEEYVGGIPDIQTKSRFMTKEELHTFLLLHIHGLSYREIKKVFRLGSQDFMLLMQQIGRYFGFISKISENDKIELLKRSFDFGIPPRFAKILPPRFPKKNKFHIKFRELVKQFLEEGKYEPYLIRIYDELERLDEKVWNAFFIYSDSWSSEEFEDKTIEENDLSILEEYLEEEGLQTEILLDLDPEEKCITNCIEAVGRTFALRIYPSMNFKIIGERRIAMDFLEREVLNFVIEIRKRSSLKKHSNSKFSELFYSENEGGMYG